MPATVAIIGCGKQAPKHIAGLRAAEPSVEILLADLEPERAQKLAAETGARWVDGPDAAFADPAVAAVSICTPTAAHAPLIRRAVAAGKHFCCEKPLTHDIADARALIDETRRADLFGMIGYTFRFAPGMVLAKGLVAGALHDPENSPLGRPVSAIFRIGGRGNHAAWKHQRANHGGAINEMLVHVLDLALWYFGPMAEVETVVCRCLQPDRRIGGQSVACDAEDLVVVRARSQDGAELLLHADFVSPAFIQYVEVHGTDGSVMASITPEVPSFVYTNTEKRGYAKGRTEQGWGNVNFYVAQMGAFLKGVAGGNPSVVAHVEHALPLVETMDRIRRYARR